MDPITMAAIAASVGEQFTQFFAQLQAYQLQKDAVSQEAKDVVRAYRMQGAEERVRTGQEREQVAAEIEALGREALGLKGRRRVSQAGAGVSGASAAEAVQEIDVEESRSRGQLRRLQGFRETATELRLKGLEFTTRSRVNALYASLGAPPSVVGLLFGSATAGLQGLAFGKELEGTL